MFRGIPTVLDKQSHSSTVWQRDKAWAVFPYGCVGSFRFLDLTPTIRDPLFHTVAARLRAPNSKETFLDVGCCLGHVVRQLIADGVPSERLYGTDLQALFLDLGYELFRDRDADKSRATYVAGDMLAEEDEGLDRLTGRIDIIYASAFFHLFEREGQVRAAKRMVMMLNLGNPRAMIFGSNGGPKVDGWEKYVLDAERWRDMWNEVGEATETSWRTEMETESSDGWIKIRFAVYRAA
jgi:SAM-dependent methyltransferase